jgi:hypothetical protein
MFVHYKNASIGSNIFKLACFSEDNFSCDRKKNQYLKNEASNDKILLQLYLLAGFLHVFSFELLNSKRN